MPPELDGVIPAEEKETARGRRGFLNGAIVAWTLQGFVKMYPCMSALFELVGGDGGDDGGTQSKCLPPD